MQANTRTAHAAARRYTPTRADFAPTAADAARAARLAHLRRAYADRRRPLVVVRLACMAGLCAVVPVALAVGGL